MLLALGLLVLVWRPLALCRDHGHPLVDPWAYCHHSVDCKSKFADGSCNRECTDPECLRDGFDCLPDIGGACDPKYRNYCQDHYSNSHCEQGCNSAPCGWDGSDCVSGQQPVWAEGTLLLQTTIPTWKIPRENTTLLWNLSTILRAPLRLRGAVPFDPEQDLFLVKSKELADLSPHAENTVQGSVLLLQVDNRPCSARPSSCLPSALLAASFLRAAQRVAPRLPGCVVAVRGVPEELGERDPPPAPLPWLWAAAGAAAVAVGVAAVAVAMRARARRGLRRGAAAAAAAADSEQQGEPRAPRCQAQPLRPERERRKRGQEAGKRRREPLGEDAIRLRPLTRDADCGGDTDGSHSSLQEAGPAGRKWVCRQEDESIRDHRPQEHMHFQASGWDGNCSSPLRTLGQSAPVQWCGPDGTVVLIRAVKSGLDRVVLELLRAGVPVNNTDHTGRSALHWACSVNNLSLAQTLIRYGAAIDLQDVKGETPLLLSAQLGCHDAARLLLLQGADPELKDRRGRSPLDLLLAHPGPPRHHHAAPQGLPGRSASFSGVIGHRGSPLHPSDWPAAAARGGWSPPQPWAPPPPPFQSVTALVSPRILGRPSRPISTLQEVTSEAEAEEEEPHAGPPPQPAPRQRSFSCTQHALRRPSAAPPGPAEPAPAGKGANETAGSAASGPAPPRLSQSESGSAPDCPGKGQSDSRTEKDRSCRPKPQSEKMKQDLSVSVGATNTAL
ncbi:neurogenic locus notch homolog protein 3 [Lepisosteus oculatus]|uniref:neurogenic locus notch homolog protein 3 n=1 Tax=Lepisosteus oculatus TaxID=7918 RepID=UPI0035F51E81